MNKKQRGAITLLVSSCILMASLILSLGSYKHIFYQVKRAQNEVEARKGYWAAEGGVECVFSKVSTSGTVPSGVVTECAPLNLDSLSITSTEYYLINAQKSSQLVKKEFTMGGNGGSGAMKSAADIYFHASTTFSTPDPGKLTDDGWECVALRYRNRFESDSPPANQGVIHGDKPSLDFDNKDKDCAPSHKTNGTGNDFLKDDTVNPFEDLFGVKKEDHNTVRDNGIFQVINMKNQNKSQCGSKITDVINSGVHHIWVEGSCEIISSDYADLASASNKTDGVFILVHDGVLSLMGASSSSSPIKGLLFHFNTDFVLGDDLSSWEGTEAYAFLSHVPSVFSSSYLISSSYYQHGAFTLSGGQIFDTLGQSALFFNAVNFKYNKDVMDSVFEGLIQPRWVKGSWHDF
ncbi:hypothetical protein [Aliivibrio finisterrensis]|uniref:Uncharacterized protein n=1 Tax=Aliivibrio finisterrensis TaxID=511998 RepID=A0A6N6RUM5_9GAMM|nr:hypothetical protein [Aliivibrio finisterrensis]KAB2825182.1 hypothetical protein F8B77_05915 [Aliivibrio finisterrensis]